MARRKTLEKGLLIVLDGIDGCGKTSQCHLLVQALTNVGYPNLATLQPGGTEIGQALRHELLHSETKYSLHQQVLLFAADRALHVENVIKPALKDKMVVVCDRWASSTDAYQGIGVSEDFLQTTELAATFGVEPDLLIILDLPVVAALARKGGDKLDKLESQDLEALEMIRERFSEYPSHLRQRMYGVIDANRSLAAVHRRVVKIINECLRLNLDPVLGL